MSGIISRQHILVSEGNDLKTTLSPVDVNQPPYPVDWTAYKELIWTLSVASVAGAPTAWSLGAKFQFAQPHSTGLRYQNPRWYDLQEENVFAHVLEGVGWYGGAHPQPIGGASGLVADQTDTLPITVSRTIVNHPAGVRMVLAPSFTGGTSPALHISLTVTGKG